MPSAPRSITPRSEYQLPLLTLPQTDDSEPLGKYGRMRLTYLKTQHPVLYNRMLLNGTLAAFAGCPENGLQVAGTHDDHSVSNNYPAPDKERAQLLWVAHMNGLKAQAEEVVVREVVYAGLNHDSSCLSIQT